MNGQRLKKIRKNMGLTQKELGKVIHVSASSICGYEKENKLPDIDTLKELCNALNTTPNYLLEFDIQTTINEDTNNAYNIYISKEDMKILTELKKYNLLYRQISSDPKKWLGKINDKFN